ncbi:MAG: hypothetical protein IK066_04940 [Kiritimatiellae bacterium]|nr:hypothetical protein [Kiritimatiellia bacterium]
MNRTNEAIINSLLCLLKAYKTEMSLPEGDLQKVIQKSLKYLISQSIRQYALPKAHYHLSRGAHARWEKLSIEDIMQKNEQDHVFCDKLEGCSRQYRLFVGAERTGTPTMITEEGFIFRQMFHKDHVIPVSMIFEKMVTMDHADAQKIRTLLNTMHICTILKEEDHRIGRTKGRSLNYRKTIDDVYTPAGIELMF